MRNPARLIGTAELARLWGWTDRNAAERARRRIKKLHKARPGPWLIKVIVREREMDRPRWQINLSLFRSLHPELFEAPDPADLEAKYGDVVERVRALEARSRAHGAALRRHDGELRQIAKGLAAIIRRPAVLSGED